MDLHQAHSQHSAHSLWEFIQIISNSTCPYQATADSLTSGELEQSQDEGQDWQSGKGAQAGASMWEGNLAENPVSNKGISL